MEIQLTCPECGGNLIWKEQQSLNECSYCGSLLYFDYRLDHPFYLEPKFRSSEQIKKIIVYHKAIQERSEKSARYRTADPSAGPDFLDLAPMDLQPFLDRFHSMISLLSLDLLYVPYHQITGILYQCLLATDRKDNKEYRFRRAYLDEAIPAYNERLWNFRDKGLRFGEVLLKQADSKLLNETPHIGFEGDPRSKMDRLIAATPPIEESPTFLFKHQVLCHSRKFPVLRPYWLVSFQCKGTEFMMIDGVFGSVAASPAKPEFMKLRSYQGKPFSHSTPSKIRIVSSRCPVCGIDFHWSARDAFRFCKNCGRALLQENGEIRTIPYLYSVDSGSSGIMIPFWRFAVKIQHQQKTYTSLKEFFSLFYMPRLLNDCHASSYIFIPATGIRRDRKGDRLLSALMADSASREQKLLEGPIQYPGPIHPGEVGSVAASELLPLSLPNLTTVHPAHQKSGALVQILKKCSLQAEAPSLCLLSYPVQEMEILVGNQSFSLQFFEHE